MEKNKKIAMIFIFIVCGLFIILWIFFVFYHKKANVCFEKKCFEVEIARDDLSREIWLMYRDKLDEKKWMLFIFDDNWIYPFWMKNTIIPLDMIWIKQVDGEFRVVDIKSADPCVSEYCDIYSPKWEAMYVLEVNLWLTKKYDIKIWDLLYFDNIL